MIRQYLLGWVLLCGGVVWGQLELPDFVPESESEEGSGATPPETESPEVEEDVEALTRRMQSRMPMLEGAETPSSEHPGHARLRKVARRYAEGPDRLRVLVVLKNGERIGGWMPNQALWVDHPVGRFPVRLGELRSLDLEEGVFRLEFQGGDVLTGRPEMTRWIVEREDTSMRHVPANRLRRLEVREGS